MTNKSHCYDARRARSQHTPEDIMSVTLHTNLGDLKVELFCEDAPRTCENFLALCASEYYDNTSFHRNIKARRAHDTGRRSHGDRAGRSEHLGRQVSRRDTR